MIQWLTDAVRLRDADGVLVLDVAEPTYEIVACVPAGVSRRRKAVASDWMVGDAETSSVLDVTSYGLVIRCLGATWAQVETAKTALVAGLSQPWWVLDVEINGVVESYRANAATQIDAPIVPAEVAATPSRRVVSVTVPVQPSPTVTGAA